MATINCKSSNLTLLETIKRIQSRIILTTYRVWPQKAGSQSILLRFGHFKYHLAKRDPKSPLPICAASPIEVILSKTSTLTLLVYSCLLASRGWLATNKRTQPITSIFTSSNSDARAFRSSSLPSAKLSKAPSRL